MIKILVPRKREHVELYRYEYEYEGEPGWGFIFPCTKDGTIDEAVLVPEARDNLRMCREGYCPGLAKKIVPLGVQNHSHYVTHPAIGQCECGKEVVLSGFTNTCECGKDYNASGQLLAPRSQWGEETGESLADILRIP